MLFERITFNMLAFSFFILIFIKMIKEKENFYIPILVLSIFGITSNMLELINKVYLGNIYKTMTFIFSIIIPLIIISLSYKNISIKQEIYMIFAKVQYKLKNNKSTKKILYKKIEKFPDSYKAHKFLGNIYESEGGVRKAIEEYVKVIDIYKSDYDTYFKIAVLLDELGKKDEVILMLNNLLRKKPDYYKASNILGILLSDQNKLKEAAKVYVDALKYKTDDDQMYYNLAIIYTKLNDFQNAKNCFEMAIELNPILYTAYYSLGQIYLIYHDIDLAKEFFEKALEDDKTKAKAYYQLAKIYLYNGNNEEAIININKAIENDKTIGKNVKQEEIFIPIKSKMTIPVEYNIKEDKKLYEESNKKEQEIETHLDETYKLIENITENSDNQKKEI